MPKPLNAVIFDLDGTIANTLPLCIAAFRRAIEPLARRVLSDEEIIATFEPTEEGTIRALIPQMLEQGTKDYLRHYDALHQEMCPSPFPGIPELLAGLGEQSIPLGLVTGKGRRSLDISLERFGMTGTFNWIETGSPQGERKADSIRCVLERLKIFPENAVYIGDTTADIAASRKAGVRIFSAAWAPTADAQSLRQQQPDMLFSSVEALREYLAPLLLPPA